MEDKLNFKDRVELDSSLDTFGEEPKKNVSGSDGSFKYTTGDLPKNNGSDSFSYTFGDVLGKEDTVPSVGYELNSYEAPSVDGYKPYTGLRVIKEYDMRPGLLGFCIPNYTHEIHVRGELQSDANDEVEKHERFHMENPGLGEGTIRNMVKYDLVLQGKTPVYHNTFFAYNPY